MSRLNLFVCAIAIVGVAACSDISIINTGGSGGQGGQGGSGSGPMNPSAPPTTPPTSGPRTPDPAPGVVLPLPQYGAVVVAQVNAANPNLVTTSCVPIYGATGWAYLSAVVAGLRAADTRWGFLCKRGNCSDVSQDAIAYHAIAGAETTGVLGVQIVDVIRDYCTAPASQYLPVGFDPSGGWTLR